MPQAPQFRTDLGVLTADGSTPFVFWSGGIGAWVREPSETSGTIGGGTVTLEYASGGPGADAAEAMATRQAYQAQDFDPDNTTGLTLGLIAITGPEGYYRMTLAGATDPDIAGYLRPAGPKLNNREDLAG